MNGKLHFVVLAIAVVLIAANACSRSTLEILSEEEEKQYQRGKSYLREGREQDALNAFLKVIENRQDAAESNLDAGRLYLTFVKDPIAAIYHFRNYLELKPDSTQAKIVVQLIETAKKEFARTLPGQPFNSAIERIDLLEIVGELKKENLALKQQLAAAKTSLKAQPDVTSSIRTVNPPVHEQRREVSVSGSDAREGDTGPRERTDNYVVKPGDTLTRISTEVYGSAGRWMDIYQANRDLLSSPHDLKVGEELKIP